MKTGRRVLRRRDGHTRLDYLQVYAVDFLYANADANTPAPLVQSEGATMAVTAQQLLDLASQKLSEISERGTSSTSSN